MKNLITSCSDGRLLWDFKIFNRKGINVYESDYFNNTTLKYSSVKLRNLLEEYDESTGHTFNLTPD